MPTVIAAEFFHRLTANDTQREEQHRQNDPA